MTVGAEDTAWLSRVAGVPLRPDGRSRSAFRGVLTVEQRGGAAPWAVACSQYALLAVRFGGEDDVHEAAIHDSYGVRSTDLESWVTTAQHCIRRAADAWLGGGRPTVRPSALRGAVPSHARGEPLAPCRVVSVGTPCGDRWVAARLLRGALSFDDFPIFPLWLDDEFALAMVGFYGDRRAVVVASALRGVSALDKVTGRVEASAP